VEITVLHVPDCPHVEPFIERVRQVMGDDATIRTEEVADEHAAKLRNMTGSPSLLVDGVNPLAHEREPMFACLAALPSVEEISVLLDRSAEA
jgi:hypothetical protein